MTFSELVTLVDEGSITMSVRENQHEKPCDIVKIRFTVSGVKGACQYDANNTGVYAFCVDDIFPSLLQEYRK